MLLLFFSDFTVEVMKRYINNFFVFCISHIFIIVLGLARRRRRTDHSLLLENGDASKTETHTKLANGYICKDCSFNADQNTDEEIAYSLAYSSSVSSAAHQTAADACMNSVVDKTGESIVLHPYLLISVFLVTRQTITNRLKNESDRTRRLLWGAFLLLQKRQKAFSV